MDITALDHQGDVVVVRNIQSIRIGVSVEPMLAILVSDGIVFHMPVNRICRIADHIETEHPEGPITWVAHG